MTRGTAGLKSLKLTGLTADSSVRRKAIALPSGDHQNPASSWSKISSQYTQERAPLRTVPEPSLVRRISALEARSRAKRSLPRTKASRRPSGDRRGTVSFSAVRVSRSKREAARSSRKRSSANA